VKLVLTNYPADQVETFDAPLYPHHVPRTASRPVPFSRELWIERYDFMEDAPKKYFRLTPGREVRLRYGHLVTCTGVVKDASGEVVEVHATVMLRGKGEPSVAADPPGARYQFEWVGYFMSDPVDSREGALVFNRTVGGAGAAAAGDRGTTTCRLRGG
jgi:hypothetical protein